jgi:hypothetical protein
MPLIIAIGGGALQGDGEKYSVARVGATLLLFDLFHTSIIVTLTLYYR